MIAVLQVEDIHTYYGASHILQGMSLADRARRGGRRHRPQRRRQDDAGALHRRADARRAAAASVFKDTDITHMPAHRIARMGVGLVPQGRRIFPSLSVREHLEVTARSRGAGRNGRSSG